MGFFSDGKKKEIEFSNLFDGVSFSNTSEDMNEHWDLKIELKIDVKSMKKINRFDDSPNENYHYVEIKNVNGKLGWLYGDADYFSFETIDYWILVSKTKLQEFIKNRVDKVYVDKASNSLYKLYNRKGRLDVITMVKTLDLVVMSSQIINKVE